MEAFVRYTALKKHEDARGWAAQLVRYDIPKVRYFDISKHSIRYLTPLRTHPLSPTQASRIASCGGCVTRHFFVDFPPYHTIVKLINARKPIIYIRRVVHASVIGVRPY